MQSYKILHFCFLLGYTGYLQVVGFFLSYSKSVHCQSTLTHLQKNVCRHRGDKVFLSGFHGDWSLLTSLPLVRKGGILIHPVAIVTILGEFLVDSRAFLFPMICFFRMEEGRAAILGEKEVCDSHTTKANVCSNPFRVSVPQVF